MTNRNNASGSNQNPSPLVGLIAAVVIVVLVILTQITGIDFVGMLGLGGTPTPGVVVTQPPGGGVNVIQLNRGIGARGDFWEVYFTQPTGSTDPSTYSGGIETPLAASINAARQTLDIAAFEFNNPAITRAVLDAHRRGVRVRVVADNEHTIEDDDTTIGQLASAGIPIVYDERSAFMHNKFMIIDGSVVWTGSMNFTINGAYRNNNNLIALRTRRAVETYQTEFEEMFTDKIFGPRNSRPNDVAFSVNGTIVRIVFSPDDNVLDAITSEIAAADDNIRFMAFSFTDDDIDQAMLSAARGGVNVQGIFEVRGSETQFSAMPVMFCAGLDVRQDGNPFTMHHKVIIIDDHTVLTGSFNFSQNAIRSNDENMVIINSPTLAAQYIAEFERVRAAASPPDGISCN